MIAYIAGARRPAYVSRMSDETNSDANPAQTGARRAASAELLYPRPELAGLIPFVFVRDTRGANLSFSQRFNHFAASPFCGLSFSLVGEGRIISSKSDFLDPQNARAAPRQCFVGPHPEPLASWNPGEVFFMMIGLYPDAFKILTGIDPFDFKQSYIPLEDILEGEVLEAAQRIAEPGSASERFARFQEAMLPLWNDRRSSGAGMAYRLTDWTRLMMMRAAMSSAGKSIRQFERRFKNLTGMSKRELEAHAKAEETFALALQAQREKDLDLADVAIAAGFADQSHMGRLTKRITGHSPEKLMRAIETEEPYWSYRLVGAHILDR